MATTMAHLCISTWKVIRGNSAFLPDRGSRKAELPRMTFHVEMHRCAMVVAMKRWWPEGRTRRGRRDQRIHRADCYRSPYRPAIVLRRPGHPPTAPRGAVACGLGSRNPDHAGDRHDRLRSFRRD